MKYFTVPTLLALLMAFFANSLPVIAISPNIPPIQSQKEHDADDLKLNDQEFTLRAALLMTNDIGLQLFILQALIDLLHDQQRPEDERDALLAWVQLAKQESSFPLVILATQNLRLSYVYFTLNELQNAEIAAGLAVEMYKVSCGNISPNVALAQNNLGWIALKAGHFAFAEQNLNSSLDILNKTVGKKSLIYGMISENLGAFYSQTENPRKALHFYKVCLKVFKKFLAKDDIQIAEIQRRCQEESAKIKTKSKGMAVAQNKTVSSETIAQRK